LTLEGQAEQIAQLQDERGPSWTDLMDLFKLQKDGKVVEGKDGWLFLHHDRNAYLDQYSGKLTLTREQLGYWRELVETRAARIAETGASYHFLVVPEGPAIYPEKLPDFVTAGERPVLQIMRHLQEARSPVRLIYPLEDMQAEKPRWEVHRRTDTHWSDAGAFIAYKTLIREIAQKALVHDVSEEEVHFADFDVQGDLAYKLDVESGPTPCLRYVYSRARLVHDNRVRLNGSLVITECEDAPPTTCVIFGDSACFAMLKVLAQSFRRLVFALTPMVDYDLINAERPDVVVTEMVERYMIDVPIDMYSVPFDELEEGIKARGPERPKLTNWDPYPELPPDAIPASIETIEEMHARLISRGRKEDALFISLMAYTGLSPSEALALRWQQIGDGVLIPESMDAASGEGRDPTGMALSVRLPEPLAEELAEWRTACGSPQTGRVFPGLVAGNWQRWLRRVYRPAVKGNAALEYGPEIVRNTFVLLQIRSGASPSEVARQTGRSRADIADSFYYFWDKRSHNAEPEDAWSEVGRVRAAFSSRTQPPSLPVRLLSRARHARTMWRARRLQSRDELPLSAETVERIRERLLDQGQNEEATFVAVMAYAGLRHGEAMALKWRQVTDGELAIEVPIGHYGSEEDGKLRVRTVTLREPLAEELAKWRADCGNPERGYVFPNFRKRDWREWVNSDYRRAAKPADRKRRHPSALCDTFCALLIAEGASVAEVARQAGISRRRAIGLYAPLFEKALLAS
jgi:integrase